MLLIIIIIVLLLVKCLLFLWEKRRLIVFFRSIRSDIYSNPIIGHASLFIGDSEKRMAALQLFGKEAIKQGGLTKLSACHVCFVVVADSEISEFILKTCLEKPKLKNLFRSFIGNASIIAPVPIWRLRRKTLAPAFAQRKINDFIPTFDKLSRRMIDNLQEHAGKESFSILKYTNAYSMDSMCVTALGIDFDVQSKPESSFLTAFEKYCEIASHRLCSPWLHNDTIYEMIPCYSVVKTHISCMWTFVGYIIKNKRKEQIITDTEKSNDIQGQETLLDFLVKPSKDTSLTDLEICEEVLGIIFAGTDTTATGAAFVLSMLSKSTSLRECVHTEIREVFGDSDRAVTAEDLLMLRYLDAVVRETMRLYPPVPVIARTTDRDVTLPTGLVIPKDCDIVLSLWAQQRNPRYWGADAEEFKPERFLNGQQRHPAAFVPFSYGPRKCSGYLYAMMSLKVVVCNLLRSFVVRHPDHNEPVEVINEPMRVKFDLMMKDVENFRIKLEKIK